MVISFPKGVGRVHHFSDCLCSKNQQLTCPLAGQAFRLHPHPRVGGGIHPQILWRLILECQYPSIPLRGPHEEIHLRLHLYPIHRAFYKHPLEGLKARDTWHSTAKPKNAVFENIKFCLLAEARLVSSAIQPTVPVTLVYSTTSDIRDLQSPSGFTEEMSPSSHDTLH